MEQDEFPLVFMELMTVKAATKYIKNKLHITYNKLRP